MDSYNDKSYIEQLQKGCKISLLEEVYKKVQKEVSDVVDGRDWVIVGDLTLNYYKIEKITINNEGAKTTYEYLARPGVLDNYYLYFLGRSLIGEREIKVLSQMEDYKEFYMDNKSSTYYVIISSKEDFDNINALKDDLEIIRKIIFESLPSVSLSFTNEFWGKISHFKTYINDSKVVLKNFNQCNRRFDEVILSGMLSIIIQAHVRLTLPAYVHGNNIRRICFDYNPFNRTISGKFSVSKDSNSYKIYTLIRECNFGFKIISNTGTPFHFDYAPLAHHSVLFKTFFTNSITKDKPQYQSEYSDIALGFFQRYMYGIYQEPYDKSEKESSYSDRHFESYFPPGGGIRNIEELFDLASNFIITDEKFTLELYDLIISYIFEIENPLKLVKNIMKYGFDRKSRIWTELERTYNILLRVSYREKNEPLPQNLFIVE